MLMAGFILADKKAESDNFPPVVVCLAAGPSQIPVIERAKALGFVVIGVDQDPHAAGGALCDHLIALSTHHPLPVIKALKNSPYARQISAVLNRSSGPPVVTAAAINEAFALPGVPVFRASQCLNKDLMREECRRQNLSVVKHQTAEKFSELMAENIPLPCVMKPALSLVGKQGVVIVRHSEQMEQAFAVAHRASVTGKVLVEEYLPGQDVSVIALVNGGRVEILAILDEINQKHDDGTVRGRAMAIPSRYAGQMETRGITQLTRQVAETFELQHSPLLLSCRISEEGLAQLMEIHLDMGGDKIMDVLLPQAGQFDALAYMIKALATDCRLDAEPIWNPTAVIFGEGNDLISNRPHLILKATTTEELEHTISQSIGKVSRP